MKPAHVIPFPAKEKASPEAKMPTRGEQWGKFNQNLYEIGEAAFMQFWTLFLMWNPYLIILGAALAPTKPRTEE